MTFRSSTVTPNNSAGKRGSDMGLKRKQLRVKPKDLVEGSLSFTLTDDMVLRVVWDGVGLSGFSAWSTQ